MNKYSSKKCIEKKKTRYTCITINIGEVCQICYSYYMYIYPQRKAKHSKYNFSAVLWRVIVQDSTICKIL